MKGEDVLCDTCGKNMTMPNGVSFSGIQIRVGIGGATDGPDRQWYAEQMAPFELDRTYNICFPCWLHSLGVRPDCPVDSPVPDDPLIVY